MMGRGAWGKGDQKDNAVYQLFRSKVQLEGTCFENMEDFSICNSIWYRAFRWPGHKAFRQGMGG